MSYILDVAKIRHGRVDDGVLDVGDLVHGVAESREQVEASRADPGVVGVHLHRVEEGVDGRP